ERRRAKTAQTRNLVLDRSKLRTKQGQVALTMVRQSAGDHGIEQASAARDTQAMAVEKGPLAALGGEELVVGGIVGDTGDDRAFTLERNRDGELRDAVQEVR